MSSNLKQIVFNIYRKSQTKKHILNYLFWECTLRCNLSCKHCGSDCLKDSLVPDMNYQDFITVLKDIKKDFDKNNRKTSELTICITGGEPLLRDDLEDCGKEISTLGFHWGIVTNGMLLTQERFLSLIKSGMRSISVSLDGLEEQHTFLRNNKTSFSKALKGIQSITSFQKEHPHYLGFDVITCVHSNNLSILPNLKKLLINNGVKAWRIFSIFPSGRADDNLSLSNEEYKNLMDFIANTRKNFKDEPIHLNYSCEGYLGEYELKVRDYFFFCRGGINVGSVMCNGDMSACLSVRGKDFIQGNIYKDNFIDIWNNRYECMRSRNWAKTGNCKKCKYWKNCLGNGLHLHKDSHSECAHCNLSMSN